jgi:hypothetical protein
VHAASICAREILKTRADRQRLKAESSPRIGDRFRRNHELIVHFDAKHDLSAWDRPSAVGAVHHDSGDGTCTLG